MKYDDLQPGERVFYTGDMANIESFGTITKRDDNPRWGLSYDISLDDGRECRGIHPSNFSGIGRRFMLKSDRDEQRRLAIEQYAAMAARRTESQV